MAPINQDAPLIIVVIIHAPRHVRRRSAETSLIYRPCILLYLCYICVTYPPLKSLFLMRLSSFLWWVVDSLYIWVTLRTQHINYCEGEQT